MTGATTYSAYGISIESNFAINALPVYRRETEKLRLDVRRVVSIESMSGAVSGALHAQGRQLSLYVEEGWITFQADGIFSARFWLTSNRIQCDVADNISDHRLQYWILQQIVPVFLFLNGSVEFLHGMAVDVTAAPCIDSPPSPYPGCIAVLGPSYSGKSTLLKYFLSRGHTMVTDDHIALSRKSYAEALPATPFYRPYRALEDVGLLAARFSPDAIPLRRLYLLTPASPGAEPRMEPVIGTEAIAAIAWHLQYTMTDPEHIQSLPFLESRFHGLMQIARQIPLARLHIPRSLDRLPEVYDLIQKDLEACHS